MHAGAKPVWPGQVFDALLYSNAQCVMRLEFCFPTQVE